MARSFSCLKRKNFSWTALNPNSLPGIVAKFPVIKVPGNVGGKGAHEERFPPLVPRVSEGLSSTSSSQLAARSPVQRIGEEGSSEVEHGCSNKLMFPPLNFLGAGQISYLGRSMLGLNQSYLVRTGLYLHMQAGVCVWKPLIRADGAGLCRITDRKFQRKHM